MEKVNPENLKEQVRDFWNQQSCDTQVARAAKFSREYFEQIESFRYFDQAFIHSFAQFSRYYGKKVLEVGFGSGTDFIQWVRAGACASGIDLTQEGLENLTHRIRVYDLPAPKKIQVADAENLPFDSNSFDLGYSFGVLHHSPNTERALNEIVRVIRPGGELKVMLYNRRSIWAFNQWVKHALLKGRPWKSIRWVLWHFNESIGTKGYTRSELMHMLQVLPLEFIQVHTQITSADYLSASAFPPLNFVFRTALRLAGHQYAWHPSHYVARSDSTENKPSPAGIGQAPEQVLLTGNRFGFFHCITARKKF